MEIEETLLRLGLFQQSVLPAIIRGICQDCRRVMTESLDDPVLATSDFIRLRT